ncbi:MAG: DUF86 domain-containing protein [Deltaproteobacteria bacterium]|nr:DUF86 domain-containing protein [Deltaproteobacteria bacterium]
MIGEAVAGLSTELRGRYTATPWRDIIGMRNAVIHGYFSVDCNEVWVAVDRDIDYLNHLDLLGQTEHLHRIDSGSSV